METMLELGVPVKKFIGHAKFVEARLYEIDYEKDKSGERKNGYLLITESGTDAIFFYNLNRLEEEGDFVEKRG